MNRLRPSAPLLIDFGAVPAAHCDGCLDHLFKALAEQPNPADEGAIWRRVEIPWIAQHVEDVTAWLQRVLLAVQEAVAEAMTGKPGGTLRKAAPWERPDDAERERRRARLEALSPAAWSLEDWMDFCELVIADHLPEEVIRTMADFAVVRAQLSGKIGAAMERMALPVPTDRRAAAIVSTLPVSRRGLPPKILTPVESAILDIAAERAAIFIGDLRDDTRKRIKQVVIEGVRKTVLGERDGGDDMLRDRLFQEFATLNRDMRRIAVTETAEAHNTGYVAGHAPGTRITRIEAYRGACDWCRSISGKTFTVVDPANPQRNGERDVWVGKANTGRSASPKMREGGALVERAPDQRWWVAAGVQHPHCRGRWVMAPAAEQPKRGDGADPAVMDWLRGVLEATRP